MRAFSFFVAIALYATLTVVLPACGAQDIAPEQTSAEVNSGAAPSMRVGGGVPINNRRQVGGACAFADDCEGECIAGMCTFLCTIDDDCPWGKVCLRDHGGTCAVPCTAAIECGNFQCAPRARANGGLRVAVCIPSHY